MSALTSPARRGPDPRRAAPKRARQRRRLARARRVVTPCHPTPPHASVPPRPLPPAPRRPSLLAASWLRRPPPLIVVPAFARRSSRAQLSEPLTGCSEELARLVTALLSVAPSARPTLAALVTEPLLQPSLGRHAAVRARSAVPPHDATIAPVEIPLIGYDGCTKTKFSERPTFVDGGRRIVDDNALSEHDAKMLATRQRRQRQVANRSGSGPRTKSEGAGVAHKADFEQTHNFGTGGLASMLASRGGRC